VTCSNYEVPRAAVPKFWVGNSDGTLCLSPVDTRLGQNYKCPRILWSTARTGSASWFQASATK